MKDRMSLLLVVLLLISGLAGGGCALDRVENPNNPSYRVVTAQVESIELAIGMRGGIGGFLRQGGGHGEGPPWFVISGKVAAIEETWARIVPELDRRAEHRPDVPAVTTSFENALEALWVDVVAKEPSKVSQSLARLSIAFEDVKGVLHRTEVDSGRLAVVVTGFLAVLIGLTVTARLVADRRDPRFMLTTWTDQSDSNLSQNS
jgi:hypothetical protein